MTPHIVHLIQSFQIGGLECMALSLAEHTQRAGFRASIIAYEEDGPLRALAQAKDIEAIYCPKPAGLRPAFSATLAMLLNSTKSSLIHTHHLGPYIYAAPLRAILGKPILHTDHSHEWCTSPRRHLIGRTIPRAATLTCVSHEIAQWHQLTFGHHAQVIENGVALPKIDNKKRIAMRQQLNLASRDVVIGCVARLAVEKDHLTLLNAIKCCPNHVKLVLVGDGPQRHAIEQHIQTLGISDRVIMLGQRHDVEDIYPAFDIVSLSSTREGLPMALLEGMGHAKPIVATRVGEIPQLLKHNVGIGAAPNNPLSLAQALLTYTQQPARRKLDGAQARQLVKTRYSIANMTDQYIGLYDQIISQRSAA